MAKTARSSALEQANDSKESILRAALQTFSEKGFDGATTREIANRAGVNHGLIPYYFGAKIKLWQAAVDRTFGELSVGLDRIIDGPDIKNEMERARLLIRYFVKYVARNPEFIRLMHEEGKRTGPRMRWLVDRHVKPIFKTVTAVTERAQEQGFLPPEISPIHFHYILAGSVAFIFHQAEECKRLTGIDPFDESVVADHIRAVEHFLIGPQDPGQTT